MTSFITLNQNSDFRRVYGRGKSYVNPALVVYVLRNRAGISRYGITVSKKVGKAVKRNRAKRIITAALLDNLPEIREGWDIVFVARARTVNCKSTQIAPVMKRLLQTAGVVKR